MRISALPQNLWDAMENAPEVVENANHGVCVFSWAFVRRWRIPERMTSCARLLIAPVLRAPDRTRCLLIAASLSALAGCSHSNHSPLSLSIGNPDRGVASISHYGCGSCHTIPGISGAHGQVGPPLSGIAGRTYLAGVLPNRPVAMEQWIRDPRSIDEKTAMPNLGVTARDAADITAYLYSLQ